MKLIIDIGNTNIVVGIFGNEVGATKVLASFRLVTPNFTTTDELALKIKELLDHHINRLSIDRTDDLEQNPSSSTTRKIRSAAFSSVVPSINHNITKLMKLYFDIDIVEITHPMFSDFQIDYVEKNDIGIDRLANIKAATEMVGTPVVVIDYGTAVTVDVVDAEKTYLGGLIIPGIGVSLEALVRNTSKLPQIELREPKHVLGNSTKASMQNGIYHLYSMGIDAVVDRIAAEHFPDNRFQLLCTGGFARFIGLNSRWQQTVVPHLTLIGSKLVLEEEQIKTAKLK